VYSPIKHGPPTNTVTARVCMQERTSVGGSLDARSMPSPPLLDSNGECVKTIEIHTFSSLVGINWLLPTVFDISAAFLYDDWAEEFKDKMFLRIPKGYESFLEKSPQFLPSGFQANRALAELCTAELRRHPDRQTHTHTHRQTDTPTANEHGRSAEFQAPNERQTSTVRTNAEEAPNFKRRTNAKQAPNKRRRSAEFQARKKKKRRTS